jgi:hypothetical protein
MLRYVYLTDEAIKIGNLENGFKLNETFIPCMVIFLNVYFSIFKVFLALWVGEGTATGSVCGRTRKTTISKAVPSGITTNSTAEMLQRTM